ncbi:transposase [Acetobacter indonesiensis NRIC 0313]|uniref:Transposase n=1 Tax=Acetobacter indonesiensis TaxID=104101 RepID=A0ABQ0KAI5_9PROT|nr:transposase [Acetobacter indonesiensis]GBQ58989.1 transposase [Acetobacter indonesiensis NRIC 0313]
MTIQRSIEAAVPFRWVAAGSVYGVVDVERTLRQAGIGYVLGVRGNHWFGSWATSQLIAGEAKDITANLPEQTWHRLSTGSGTKGERLYGWAYLPLADLDAEVFDCPIAGLRTRGLLIRRNIADGDLAYFTTWCPKGTIMQELVNVEGTRWRIEDCFETAKNEFGLDHNETRSWHGWHRHVSLVMLGYAVMPSVRYQANSLK